MIKSAAKSSDNDDIPCSALDGAFDGKLCIGEIFFGGNSDHFNFVGNFAAVEGVKISYKDLHGIVEQLRVFITRICGDREIVSLWMLGDTVLMSGEVLLVESQLADFSITILSTPVQGISGSAGTTAETSEKQTSEPLDTVTEIEHDTSEPKETLSEAEASAVESEAVSEPSADGE